MVEPSDELQSVFEKAIKVIKSDNISDCWKEKAIPIYAISMFKYSIKSFFILVFIFSIFFLPSFFLDKFFYFSISIIGIIESIVLCALLEKTFKYSAMLDSAVNFG